MTAATGKERALEAIRTLPDGASLDEAIERLCFLAKIDDGLRQSRARQVVDHEDVKKRFQK